MRCFVAVNVAEPVRKMILRVQDALRRADADVRWVGEETLHLTLKFCGDLGEEEVGRLRGLLAVEAGRWRPMALVYAGVGTFPERGAPRVVWAGATGDVERLSGLARAVERHAETVGVGPERFPFVPHLTIGRVKSDRNVKRLRSALEPQRAVPLGKDEVREFVLFRSTLTSDGPIYDVVETYPLAPPSVIQAAPPVIRDS
jgi:2'-5' RNA ligase